MGVMEQIAGQIGKFRKHLSSHLSMARGGDKHTHSGRLEQVGNEFPGLLYAAGPLHHPRMSGHSQKFVQNGPTRVPGIGPPALALKPRSRRSMEWRISVRSIDQDIGVNENQCLSAFHRLIQRVPVGNVNQNAAAMEDRQGW